MGKKRRSRIIDEAEFREAFGYRQNASARQTPRTVIKTYSPPIGRNGNFPSDSASWTSRDELGSSGDLIEERIETYSSSGVGSESSELPSGLEIPEIPLEMQLQINRRASRYKPELEIFLFDFEPKIFV